MPIDFFQVVSVEKPAVTKDPEGREHPVEIIDDNGKKRLKMEKAEVIRHVTETPLPTKLALSGASVRGAIYAGMLDVAGKAGQLNNIREIVASSAGTAPALVLSLGGTSDDVLDETRKVNFRQMIDVNWAKKNPESVSAEIKHPTQPEVVIPSPPRPSLLSRFGQGIANKLQWVANNTLVNLVKNLRSKGGGLCKGEKLHENVRDTAIKYLKKSITGMMDAKVNDDEKMAFLNQLQAQGILTIEAGKIHINENFTFRQQHWLADNFPEHFKRLYICVSSLSENEPIVCGLDRGTLDIPVIEAGTASMSLPPIMPNRVLTVKIYNGDVEAGEKAVKCSDGALLTPDPAAVLNRGKPMSAEAALDTLNLRVDGTKGMRQFYEKRPERKMGFWDRLKDKVLGASYFEAAKKNAEELKVYSHATIQGDTVGIGTFKFNVNHDNVEKLIESGRQAAMQQRFEPGAREVMYHDYRFISDLNPEQRVQFFEALVKSPRELFGLVAKTDEEIAQKRAQYLVLAQEYLKSTLDPPKTPANEVISSPRAATENQLEAMRERYLTAMEHASQNKHFVVFHKNASTGPQSESKEPSSPIAEQGEVHRVRFHKK